MNDSQDEMLNRLRRIETKLSRFVAGEPDVPGIRPPSRREKLLENALVDALSKLAGAEDYSTGENFDSFVEDTRARLELNEKELLK